MIPVNSKTSSDHSLLVIFNLKTLFSHFFFFSESEFDPPCKKVRKPSSGSEGLHHSPIKDPVVKTGEYVVVYVAVEFKLRKPGSHSAGISIYWGDMHTCNESLPLRGDKLTREKAQLIGKCMSGRGEWLYRNYVTIF